MLSLLVNDTVVGFKYAGKAFNIKLLKKLCNARNHWKKLKTANKVG